MNASSTFVPKPVIATLRDVLPEVATACAKAVIAEVPEYSALRGPEGDTLDHQVELALRGFLAIAAESESADAVVPFQPALDASFALGRGEFRSGRTTDVLLSAYRIGARAAWREWGQVVIESGISIELFSQFAEMIFAYIDQLSASSVAGYSHELEASQRSRSRRFEELARRILAGGPTETLQAEAEKANWDPPEAVSAVIVAAGKAQGIRNLVDTRSLIVPGNLPGLEDEDYMLILVPTSRASERSRLKEALGGRAAVLGPARPWQHAGQSYSRALKVFALTGTETGTDTIDTGDFLIELVVGADPEALEDLRSDVLSPLSSLRPSTAEKLRTTLKAWLVHQGRRDEIATALHVHPQTVRYRMGQLREIYGERLDDPELVEAATIALSVDWSKRQIAPRVSDVLS
jgi:hypothetical protein